MLDEFLDLDRDRKRGSAQSQRPGGVRGFFGRLIGGLADGDDVDQHRRRDRDRSGDDDDRRPEDGRRRRQDDDRFDFGDD